VNTNKKIQKSTGYFIFLLKMPRNLERPPANLQELERVLHEIWHEIPQDSIRACINTLPAVHLSNRRYAAAGEIHAGSTARQR